MRFKADEITSVLQSEIQAYEKKLDIREVGRVLEVGDGIARVYGLANAMAGTGAHEGRLRRSGLLRR